MKITKISCEHLRYAKTFDITEHYVIAYTGRSVLVLNKQLELLHRIDGLKYAYAGEVSPDETKLLVVSIKNLFYVISMHDFCLTKVRISGDYTDNLEGEGCWAQDSRHLYIPVQSERTLNSALRKYDTHDFSQYTDYFPQEYWITNITYVAKRNKHLIMALDRKTQVWNMLWFDEDKTDIFGVYGFDDALFHVDVNEESEEIILYGSETAVICDFEGQQPSYERKPKSSTNLPYSLSEIRRILENTRMYKLRKEVSLECITALRISAISAHLYIGTDEGLVVVNCNDSSDITEYRFEYGVNKIGELSNGIVMISNSFKMGIVKFELTN